MRIRDPLDLGSGIRYEHPGYATLVHVEICFTRINLWYRRYGTGYCYLAPSRP
jgi:hypothetical protein